MQGISPASGNTNQSFQEHDFIHQISFTHCAFCPCRQTSLWTVPVFLPVDCLIADLQGYVFQKNLSYLFFAHYLYIIFSFSSVFPPLCNQSLFLKFMGLFKLPSIFAILFVFSMPLFPCLPFSLQGQVLLLDIIRSLSHAFSCLSLDCFVKVSK